MSDQLDYETLKKEVKEALQNNDQASAAAKIQQYMEQQNNIPLNIAITGETGVGKSSFVNALRGISDDDEAAAPTGPVETTTEVMSYPHPNIPNVTLWDLPGIGSPNFKADEYLELVGFDKFDFFIIISADRFRENDAKLALEIQKMKKKFYFVRSKIDNDICNERRTKKRLFNRETTLTRMKENCIQGLQEQGFKSPQVFLISSVDLHLYDFDLLVETLWKELPEHKRDALLFAAPIISLEIINKKKRAFRKKIKWYATLSAAVAGIPVPGISATVDIGLMVSVVTRYVVGFGLDVPSLQRLANRTGVPYKDLLDVIISPLSAKKITAELIMKLLIQCLTISALIAGEEVTRLIPLVGIPVAMSLSFIATYRGLSGFLDMLSEDAQKVFTKALGLEAAV